MNRKSLILLLFFIALSIPAVWHIITPGYFPMHDDTQIVRVQQMYEALGEGQFPVRWVPDLGYGYGYPIFNFYNPLPYYVGTLFMFLGFNALIATKLMFILSVIGSLFSMYIFARLILPRWGALLSGIFYLYAPYHGVQIYVRGAVGEYWAYALLPLVFWAVLKRRVIVGSVALGFLITSHNLTAFMAMPFIFMLTTLEILKEKHKRLLLTTYCLLLTVSIGLSAFFWLPAIFESSQTRLSEMVFKEFDPPALHLVSPVQLWTGPWGYGGSSQRGDDGLSLQIGKVHIFGSFFAIVVFLYCHIAKKAMTQSNNLTIFTVTALLFSVMIMLPMSKPIWENITLLSYIQFPWRFLTFASLFSSFLATWGIWMGINIINGMKNIKFLSYLFFIVFCSFFLAYSLKFFQPQFKFPTTAEKQTTREKIVWEVSGRSDEYLPKNFERPKTMMEALRGGNPRNQQLVDMLKQTTPFRIAGNAISILSIVGILVYSFWSRKNIWITK